MLKSDASHLVIPNPRKLKKPHLFLATASLRTIFFDRFSTHWCWSSTVLAITSKSLAVVRSTKILKKKRVHFFVYTFFFIPRVEYITERKIIIPTTL